MSVKVEIGFTNAGVGTPFFIIGDAVQGVIGSTEYRIGGGEVYVDIGEFFQTLSLGRGKGRELDRFDAGGLVVTFDNSNRFFDPTYQSSPYFGQIVPKRSVRISIDDQVQFLGIVDDWDITYGAGGNSVATLKAFDAFSILANNQLQNFSSSQETTGERIDAVLDDINWPSGLRDIDTGDETIVATSNSNEDALSYLTKVERSELGYLFINKLGQVRFVSRSASLGTPTVTLSDDGTEIPYINIGVSYGSEFLYNRITNVSPAGTAVVSDADSQGLYGTFDFEAQTLNTSGRLSFIASNLLAKYREPELRFQNLTVAMNAITESQRSDLLGVELGDLIEVVFTPSKIPPAVTDYAIVIGIEHQISNDQELLTFQLASTQGSPFILDSVVFGIMDSSPLGL